MTSSPSDTHLTSDTPNVFKLNNLLAMVRDENSFTENTTLTQQYLEEALSIAPLSLEALLLLSKLFRRTGRISDALALGQQILEAYFFAEHGRVLPQNRPRSFTEKLYCRMLDIHANGNPLYTQLADKILVRDHVARTIGEKYLTNLIWQGEHGEDIPWGSLPLRSILKCNEGSGKLLQLSLPCDKTQIQTQISSWQSDSYYWFRREYHYWEMPRRLLIEGVLDDGHSDGPIDYIFYCFDGMPRLVQIGSRSHTIHCFYTPDWEKVELSYRTRYEAPDIPRPPGLGAMLDIATQLSTGFDFVRVDLYNCREKIYFGELTFTPRAGWIPFSPKHWDDELGAYWSYPSP